MSKFYTSFRIVAFVVVLALACVSLPAVAQVSFLSLKTHKSFYINAFPSASPYSEKFAEAMLKSRSAMIKAGYRDDVDALSLAFENRDQAWATAEKIVNGIINKSITSGNILDYASEDFKAIVTPNMKVFDGMIKTIQSYGNKAKLSIEDNKELALDFMRIEKQVSEDTVRITVIDRIDNRIAEMEKGTPYTYVTITLSAEKPYEKWLLSGLHISKGKKI